MNLQPNQSIVTLADGSQGIQTTVTTTTTITLTDLQSQLATLEGDLLAGQDQRASFQAQFTAADQNVNDIQAQIATLQAQIAALTPAPIVAEPPVTVDLAQTNDVAS